MGGKGNAYGRARSEEVAERTRGRAELAEAGNGLGLSAGRVETKSCGIGSIVHRHGQGGNVRDVIVARILPVEQIEEFDEGPEHGALAKNKVPAKAQIHLIERRAAEFVERGLHAIDDCTVVGDTVPVDIGGRGDGERTRALKLRNCRSLQVPGEL